MTASQSELVATPRPGLDPGAPEDGPFWVPQRRPDVRTNPMGVGGAMPVLAERT